MARLTIPTMETAPEGSRRILESVQKQAGFAPAVLRVVANSPTALKALIDYQMTLASTLDEKTRQAIQIAVTAVNSSPYCMIAHSFVAVKVQNSTTEEVERNKMGDSSDPKSAAAVKFAQKMMSERGLVSDEDLVAVRDAGYSDADIIDIIFVSVQALITNFVNNVANTEADFPVVSGAV